MQSKRPRAGAILINPNYTHILLVTGGCRKPTNPRRVTYTLPKGKIEPHEQKAQAAHREVLEETGYDCDGLVNGDHCYEERKVGRQMITCYFVENVPLNYEFKAECPYEVNGHLFVPLHPSALRRTGVILSACVKAFLPGVRRFCQLKREEQQKQKEMPVKKKKRRRRGGDRRGSEVWVPVV